MAMTYLGIDGGGSNLRLAVTDENLNVLAEAQRETANPSSIGRDAAKRLIQDAIREIVAKSPPIQAVGIGIAGAAKVHSADWLREVVREILPRVRVVPSSDMEIALVGANGERRGVLILAGTGSVAYGINKASEELQVGGWGYLLGDEGGGYSIGMEALRTISHTFDGTHDYASSLYRRIMDDLNFSHPKDLIAWLYRGDSKVREVAKLAALVVEEADRGDSRAIAVIENAAGHLSRLTQTTIRRLAIEQPQIAFAGGLLSEPNPLSTRLMSHLNLTTFPTAKYPPVIGAALLAKMADDGS
jgi:glucosamine kinase